MGICVSSLIISGVGEHLQSVFQWIRERKNKRVVELVLGFRDLYYGRE